MKMQFPPEFSLHAHIRIMNFACICGICVFYPFGAFCVFCVLCILLVFLPNHIFSQKYVFSWKIHISTKMLIFQIFACSRTLTFRKNAPGPSNNVIFGISGSKTVCPKKGLTWEFTWKLYNHENAVSHLNFHYIRTFL